jgi:cellulose synthase (UDP-forming)
MTMERATGDRTPLVLAPQIGELDETARQPVAVAAGIPAQRVIALPVTSRRDRLVLTAFAIAWLAANIVYWSWWLQPEHIVTLPRFVVASLALGYDLTLMPAIFLFFLFRMRRPTPIEPPPGLRVAMATAVVPSVEALDVLERTVAGMVANQYPHDSWVLDEGGDPRVHELCQRHGALYWSRHGVPDLNQRQWPFQAKTKSGNYNGWLDMVGYERYDYLIQLDSDHVPAPDYLERVLGYFADPDVAYVALPSVYSNLNDWPARGSSEQSQIFQGPIQMGYFGWARSPMIIGSHAAYRMAHLREIGGFGPSRAEDHLDTLALVRAGHQGVFVPDILAVGLGPHTIADYIVQEHQWAFSIAQVFLKYGRGKGRLSLRQRAVFLFSELWYSVFALSYLTLYLLPLIALLTNAPIVKTPFLAFALYSQPIILVSIALLAWCHHRGWFRPGTHFFMSWQGIILTMARWPIVMIALVNALVSVAARGGAFRYMVTPKGTRGVTAPQSLRVASQFVVLAAAPAIVAILYPWLAHGTGNEASGYVVFALVSSVIYGLLVLAVALDHVRANRRAGQRRRPTWLGAAPLLLVTLLIFGGATAGVAVNLERTSIALTYWPGVLRDGEPAPAHTVPALAPATASPTAPVAIVPTPTSPPPDTTPAAAPAVTSWLFDTTRSGVTFGAYDPDGALTSISNLEHIYASWTDDGHGGVPVDTIRAARDRGVPVMLSLEPQPIAGLDRGDVVLDIIAGRYDGVIRDAARAATSTQVTILLRFAHEMDMTGLYPWSGAQPPSFITAWIHVARAFQREGATNILWVWSPGGTLDSPRFYPGATWVDYVGMTVLQHTGWELEAGYDPPREYKELINEKYQLLGQFGKPLIIAEAGVSLEPDLNDAALRQMIEILPWFPRIRAVVYFNARNPRTTITPFRPDWSLDSASIDLLRKALDVSHVIEP